MHESRDGEWCHVEIFRKAFDEVVIAESEVPGVGEILKRCGFVEKRHVPIYRWWQLPKGMGPAEEAARATRAAVVLRTAGLKVDLDPGLVDPDTKIRMYREATQHTPTPPSPPSPPVPGRPGAWPATGGRAPTGGWREAS